MSRSAGATPNQGLLSGSRKPLWARATPGKPDAELLSDADLLELTALGDQQAFARLYNSFSPQVIAAVRQLLTEAHAAVVHDVFVDVWQLAPQFEEIVERAPIPAGGVPVISRADSTAWILKVARRRAIDRLRAANVQHTDAHLSGDQHSGDQHPDEPRPVEQHSDEPQPGEHHGDYVFDTHRVDQQSLPACKLTAPERETIALAVGGGYTEDEVAVILDERVATVRARLHRGLLRLHPAPRSRRGAPHPIDTTRRARTELTECAPCRRSAQLLLEPAQRGAGEAAASILRSLPTKG